MKCTKEVKEIAAKIAGPKVTVDCPEDMAHISLSKCLYLKDFQKESFIAQISAGMKSIKP